MKNIDFTAVGYPSIDRIIKIDRDVCAGQTSIVINKDNFMQHYGGCNVNIAYLASRFGLKTGLMMNVGNDFESSGFKEFLLDGNVMLDGIKEINADITSCSYLIENPEGEHITLFYPGAMHTKYSVMLNEDVIKRSKYGVITVGNPEYNLEFAKLCKKNNVPMVFGMKCDFNSLNKNVLSELISGCEILVMNQGERKEIERIYHLDDITDILKNIITKIIIVTKGSDGSRIYFKQKGIRHVDIPVAKPKKVVDTAGVGDAYLAGFLLGYSQGKTVEQCGRIGAVLSSFIIEKTGCLTNVPTIKELKERYRTNFEEDI